MSIEAKAQYLGRIYDRYQRAGRQHKSRILDEFCSVCGYHRKAALRLLNRPVARAAKRRPGPKPIYDAPKVLGPLKTIWLASEQPCGKRLREIIPLWLPHLKKGVSPAVRQQLLDLSAATLDRLLAPARAASPAGSGYDQAGIAFAPPSGVAGWAGQHHRAGASGSRYRGPLRRHHRWRLRP